MKQVDIYTDGACRGNPGPGGWAALLIYGAKEKEISGHVEQTTNNRMELMAAIKALRALSQPCKITLHTDSKYVQQGITEWVEGWEARGWRTADKKPVKNVDLWQALVKEAERHDIHWKWVKGHADNELHNRVDALAVKASTR